MSYVGGGRGSLEGSGRDPRTVREHVEERRAVRSEVLGTGTLACGRCDAPVAIGPGQWALTEPLVCPFCAHAGAVRDFLSLAAVARPARVVVRVSRPSSTPSHPRSDVPNAPSRSEILGG